MARIWIPGACEPALIHDSAHMLPRLADLPVPTLLLHGAASPPVIAEITAHIVATVPDARAHTLSGAAHMAPLTHPAETARAIESFLPGA